MNTAANAQLFWLAGGVAGVLGLAEALSVMLRRSARNAARRLTVANLSSRVHAWWVLCGLLIAALLAGVPGVAVLFGAASFLALRELLSLAPLQPADHRTLAVAFYLLVPLQFVLASSGHLLLFALALPLGSLLVLPLCSALAGDCARFGERAAALQWGLLVCVFGPSFVPALLTMHLVAGHAAAVGLLLFLITTTEASDVLQYVWGKLFGRHRIAPRLSPNKSWEGLVGGIGTVALLGAALWWLTPFAPMQAAALACVAALAGFAGGLVLSAVKRGAGVKDFGTLIAGHGGVLDRLDSLCFAAPVYFLMVMAITAPRG